jgi:hypothetical protein
VCLSILKSGSRISAEKRGFTGTGDSETYNREVHFYSLLFLQVSGTIVRVRRVSLPLLISAPR